MHFPYWDSVRSESGHGTTRFYPFSWCRVGKSVPNAHSHCIFRKNLPAGSQKRKESFDSRFLNKNTCLCHTFSNKNENENGSESMEFHELPAVCSVPKDSVGPGSSLVPIEATLVSRPFVPSVGKTEFVSTRYSGSKGKKSGPLFQSPNYRGINENSIGNGVLSATRFDR